MVKSGSASLVKRTTGTNSGNIRASGGQGFKVRAYATDRLGHRWYGPASDSYIYLTSNKTFKKSTFQLGGGIFESQPPNP